MNYLKTKPITIILLLPDRLRETEKVEAKLLQLFTPRAVNIYFYGFEQIQGKDVIAVSNFFSDFINNCEEADIIILNNWLPVIPLKFFHTLPRSKKQNNYNQKRNSEFVYVTKINKPKQRTFQGMAEMRSLAEHLHTISSAKIYALAGGFSSLTPINDYAGLIFSYHDNIILKNYLQAQ